MFRTFCLKRLFFGYNSRQVVCKTWFYLLFLADKFYCSTRGNTWSTWPTSDSVPLYDQHFEQRQQQRSKTSRGRLCVGQMAHHVPTIHPVCPVWIFRNIVVLGTKKGQGGKGSPQKCGGETYWQQWWHRHKDHQDSFSTWQRFQVKGFQNWQILAHCIPHSFHYHVHLVLDSSLQSMKTHLTMPVFALLRQNQTISQVQ